MNSKRIERRDRDDGIQYWAFLGNPRFYDVEGAVQSLAEDVWLTRGREIRKGDRAVIWKAKGGTPTRGVVAFAEIITDPDSDIPIDSAFWKDESRIHGSEPRVRVRYQISMSLPLWEGDVGNEILDTLTVRNSTGGSIFRVTPEQWLELVQMAGISTMLTRPAEEDAF